jgi:recombination protein RecA
MPPLDETLKAIEKRYPGAVIRGNDPSLVIEHLPTGILALDSVVGGFARGRHTEIFGGYGVGKTATTYRFIAHSQAHGLKCAFIDVESTFDPAFAAHLGVDLEMLVFPERGQNANVLVNIMETLLRSGEYDVIVLDSIAALLPKAEEESDMESGNFGTQQAKLMSQALRRLTAANRRTALVYINQTREAIGVMFGKKTVTSGGRAMAFYAGTRLEMVRTESVKKKVRRINHKTSAETKEEVVWGHRVLVRVDKDKTGRTQQGAETTMVFSYDLNDFDPIEDLIYLGRLLNLIHVSGTKWYIDGQQESTGRARFKRWLRENVEQQVNLEEAIRSVEKVDENGEDDEI